MNDIDDKIRQALQSCGADDELDPDRYDSIIGLTATILRSRWRGWLILVYFWTLVFFVLGILCAVRFFGATSVRAMIAYAVAFLWLNQGVGLLKQWVWMQMDKNALKIEIKRLQLLVVEALERTTPAQD